MRALSAGTCAVTLITVLLLIPNSPPAASPAHSWTTATEIEPPGTSPDDASVYAVSCPSSRRCVAVDAGGRALTWRRGSWSLPVPVWAGGTLTGVSCASIRHCVAASASGVAVTYNGKKWGSPAKIGSAATYRLSCPTTTYCGAIGASGTPGAPSVTATFNGLTWTPSLTHSTGSTADRLLTLACPRAEHCTALNGNGQILKLARGHWIPGVQTLRPGATSISCPSTARCIAVGTTGFRSGGESAWFAQWSGGRWSSARPIPGMENSIVLLSSCPSVRQCMVIGLNGKATVWVKHSWSAPRRVFPGYSGTVDVSCAAVNRCVAVNSKGMAAEFR